MKMPQKLTQQQIQEQRQQTLQRLSQQQMLQVKLLEMPLAQLEQSVNSEMDDNPALERSVDEESYAYDEYLDLFDDEMHWLIVFSTDGDEEWEDWYWEGMQDGSHLTLVSLRVQRAS